MPPAALGVLVCAAWYYTILAGFFILYCPVLYVMFFNHRLYRNLADTLFALWELFPVALFQCCCKTQLHHYGDYVDRDENCIIVMNHRTRVDWNYVWIALYHATQKNDGAADETHNASNTSRVDSHTFDARCEEYGALDAIGGGKAKIKFVLKDELKMVPGLGWIMQLNFFLYVKRSWREDQLGLAQFTDYYRRVRSGYRLVLFPEGTDLSDENRRKSDRFAVANNLSHLDFVLHPRTTGWTVLVSRLRGAALAAVYDVTVAYDAPAQTEADLLKGKLPKHVYFHFKRYPIERLPEEEDQLRVWLNDRWREKEYSLRQFHNNGNFCDSLNRTPTERKPRSLKTAKLAFVFWSFIDLLFMYSIFYSMVFQFWVLYHSLLFTFVTWWFGGFHNIQYKILEMSKK
ncbi:lysocardiolipin acyltransferase 1 [Plutella xylostella]|uniref:lysocardiolipin acyltransferase 1 n=1 Tax=Plutella xylostella TaxID=51655 RepID=UPI0020327BF3|nr:lysocardiolipin acyltransferase 1 [Plutella xylostella]